MSLTAKQAFEAIRARNQNYYDIYDAWYSGDEDRLRSVAKPSTFWSSVKTCNRKMHVPVAAEIASASAELLFAEPPSIFVMSDGTKKDTKKLGSESNQNRLDDILALNNFDAKSYAAAEIGAVLADVYYKANWNEEIADYPLINVVRAQQGLPEYSYDVLQAIHFFTTVDDSDANKVKWIYERYEKRRIYTQEWLGTVTEPIEPMGEEAELDTGVDAIAAIHIPNLTPNRHFRSLTRGRSCLDGVIGLMDGLDEAYSSWLRDLNLGKARLIVPRDYFHMDKSPFHGDDSNAFTAYFDKNDEVFVAMDVDPDKGANGGFVNTQFEIRSAQHKETCLAIYERIVTAAGFSPQSFGLQIQGSAESGTALNVRERKTYTLKARKELYWRRSLEQFISTVLEIDKVVFGQQHASTKVSIEFKEPAQDLNNVAQALQMLNSAGAISTYEKVKRVNPDWTPDQIEEEVQRIQMETGGILYEDQLNPPPDELDTSETQIDPDAEDDGNAA